MTDIREELKAQLEAGGLDKGTRLIALLLLDEVLPAMDRIIRTLDGRLWYAEKALSQIYVIYAWLQDLAPSKAAGLGRARAQLEEKLEKAIKFFEAGGKKQ
jgi:hypothetical protein